MDDTMQPMMKSQQENLYEDHEGGEKEKNKLSSFNKNRKNPQKQEQTESVSDSHDPDRLKEAFEQYNMVAVTNKSNRNEWAHRLKSYFTLQIFY